MMWQQEYRDCLDYIDEYWDRITFQPTKQEINHHVIEIPHAYITPNDKKFNYIFYWDTFFMFRGLMGTRREWVMRDMVNNFCFLFQSYGSIPNFNSPASMGRSQPPFLSSMIFDVYNNLRIAIERKTTIEKTLSYLSQLMTPKKWLSKMIDVAKQEYQEVWLDPEGMHHHRIKNQLLSRYGDLDVGYAHSSELESGWDFTSRFYNRCNDFLPVDLNTFLYKYENDFARAAGIFGNSEEEMLWQSKMHKRQEEITRLMWNEKEGFFYDYDYKREKQSTFLSLAGFVPLWAGLATADQSEKMIEKLKQFDSPYGLFITDQRSLAPKANLSMLPEPFRPAVERILKPKQWDHPHIWAPLEYLTVIGLLRYGYVKTAREIIEKSVKTHASLFRKYKTFFEKTNGVTGDKSEDFHYEAQSGFGWTNAIFYRYIQILDHIDNGKDVYHGQRQKPPYSFAIPH